MNDTASIEQIKAGMRATWMAGDFGVVAKTIALSGEQFAARIVLPTGAQVLDVACGTGNVAMPIARRLAGDEKARVVGADIAANLLVQARARAAAEGVKIAFDEGDAEQLPYADASFDVVATMFGAMFAPRPEVVAAEFARVLKPGGLLAMANWNPASFTGRMFRVGSKHAPPPPGLAAPVLWGDEAIVRERLGGEFTDITTSLIRIDFDMAMDAAGAVSFFRKYFGPTQMAFARVFKDSGEAGEAALAADLETLWSDANVATDPESHVLIHNEYLEVLATRA